METKQLEYSDYAAIDLGKALPRPAPKKATLDLAKLADFLAQKAAARRAIKAGV